MVAGGVVAAWTTSVVIGIALRGMPPVRRVHAVRGLVWGPLVVGVMALAVPLTLPSWLTGLVLLMTASRALDVAVRLGGDLRAARARARALWALSHPGPDRTRVLPVSVPLACAIGVVRPTIYLSSGCAPHRDVVLAHERAHVRRRDALHRVLAEVASVAHVPWVWATLEPRLRVAQEMTADADAVATVGDPRRVVAAFAMARVSH